jgi:hypothetical protein
MSNWYRNLVNLIESAIDEDVSDGYYPATERNIKLAKAFVFDKWKERAYERMGGLDSYSPPTDLSNSCKFTSQFVKNIFGGTIQGNFDHQYVVKDGAIIDLNIDAKDVKTLGDKAHVHDPKFFGKRDHKASMKSCEPRVAAWTQEFLSKYGSKLDKKPIYEQVIEPITVYHVTPKRNLKSIKSNGLTPQIGDNSTRLGETEEAIHVFYNLDDLEDALSNWDLFDEDEELVCLKITVPKNEVKDDPAYPNSVGLIKTVVPPQNIKKMNIEL